MENIPQMCNDCPGYETEGCYLLEVQARPNYRSDIIISRDTIYRKCTSDQVSESFRRNRDLSRSLDELHADTKRLRGMHEDTLELGVYEPFARDPTK
tara:strand:+ start:5447 stop:5737 length:291 start_codon:yes stop_codon:yes gene_type:complete